MCSRSKLRFVIGYTASLSFASLQQSLPELVLDTCKFETKLDAMLSFLTYKAAFVMLHNNPWLLDALHTWRLEDALHTRGGPRRDMANISAAMQSPLCAAMKSQRMIHKPAALHVHRLATTYLKDEMPPVTACNDSKTKPSRQEALSMMTVQFVQCTAAHSLLWSKLSILTEFTQSLCLGMRVSVVHAVNACRC